MAAGATVACVCSLAITYAGRHLSIIADRPEVHCTRQSGELRRAERWPLAKGATGKGRQKRSRGELGDPPP